MPSLSDAIIKHSVAKPDAVALRGAGSEFTYKQTADAVCVRGNAARQGRRRR